MSNNDKINLEDIAEAVGVSKATVSNALNDRGGVSEKTRQEILVTAENMGYKKFKKKKNQFEKYIRIILYKKHGFVVSDTPFFLNVIEGIQRQCRQQNYELLISHVSGKDENPAEINGGENVSGYLLLATEMLKEDLRKFNHIDKPLVLLDSYFQYEDYDYVLINNKSAAYKATNYLIDKGHQEIGYLHSSKYINNFKFRKIGFKKALQDSDIDINKDYWYQIEPTLEGSYRDMKNQLNQKNKKLPTAFFADNDIIAYGAVKALKENGVKIPEQVSIVGFDDMPYCEITSPKITTIRVFKQYIGKLAVNRLIEKIEEEDQVNQKIEVNCEIVERESVKDLNMSN